MLARIAHGISNEASSIRAWLQARLRDPSKNSQRRHEAQKAEWYGARLVGILASTKQIPAAGELDCSHRPHIRAQKSEAPGGLLRFCEM